MEKKILGLVIGFLLIGFNLFAADGDLIVNGNVGIGTVSPSDRLEVRGGGIRTSIGTSGASDGVLYFGSDATNYVYGGNQNNIMAFGTNGSERVRIDNYGNVGIGTASPGARLTIVSPDGAGFYPMVQLSAWQSGGNTKGGAIDFHVNSISFYPSSRIVHTMTDGYGGELQFHTTPNYTTTLPSAKMVITDDGNVGIGTTAPTAKLEVVGLIKFQSAAMSSPEDMFLKSIAAFYAAALGGAPVYYYWNDGAGQSCTTKCSNMGHTCIYGFAVHQSYISMPTCSYSATAGLACLCQ